MRNKRFLKISEFFIFHKSELKSFKNLESTKSHFPPFRGRRENSTVMSGILEICDGSDEFLPVKARRSRLDSCRIAYKNWTKQNAYHKVFKML